MVATQSLEEGGSGRDDAKREQWGPADRGRFETPHEKIKTRSDVEEAFLIVRPGKGELIDHGVAVASWPRWETAGLSEGRTPVLDALAELAIKLYGGGFVR